jgi:hypothetical protein
MMRLTTILMLVLGGCLAGCEAINSGPKMMTTVAQGVTTFGTVMIERLDPTEMTASASGSVTNPQFVSDGFVGTGVGWHMTLQLVGADLRFGVAAAGHGSKAMDPATVKQISDIWMDPVHNEQERQALIGQAVMQWLLKQTVSPTEAPSSGDVTGGGAVETPSPSPEDGAPGLTPGSGAPVVAKSDGEP